MTPAVSKLPKHVKLPKVYNKSRRKKKVNECVEFTGLEISTLWFFYFIIKTEPQIIPDM